MKRILAILLIIPVFLFSVPLAFSASASETTGQYFDVLDYVGVNGTTSSSTQISGLTEVVFDLSLLLGDFTVYGFDLTFTTDSNADILKSLSFADATSSLKGGYVKDGVYRYRGNFEGVTGSLFSLLFSSSYSISVNFISFNVYTVWNNYVPISGVISTSGSAKEFYPGSSSTISVTADNFGKSVTVAFEDWRNYDFIEFGIAFIVNDIHSVFVGLQPNTSESPLYSLPVTITPFTASSSDGQSQYAFVVRVDLTELNHATAPDSYVVVNFSLSPVLNSYNTVTIYTANGIVFQGESDPALKWYQILYNNISFGFMNLENSIANFSDSVTGLFDHWFNSLFEKLDSYFNTKSDSEIDEAENTLDEIEENSEDESAMIDGVQNSFEEIQIDVYIPSDHNNDGFVQYYFQNFLQMFYVYDIVAFRFNVIIILAIFSYILFGKKL